jgi:hypothetical protein
MSSGTEEDHMEEKERKSIKSYDRCMFVSVETKQNTTRNERKRDQEKQSLHQHKGSCIQNRSVNTYTKRETPSSISTSAVFMAKKRGKMTNDRGIEKSTFREKQNRVSTFDSHHHHNGYFFPFSQSIRSIT